MPAPSDLIHETSTTTGTGNFTLTNVNGKRSFNTGFGTGGSNLFDYYISNRDAAEWERGTGHLSAASTLVRDTTIASSNANAAVNFSAGTKDVCNDIPAANQARLDAANSWSASQTFINSSGIKIKDTDASHSTGIVGGTNLTADRTFTLTLGDANRTLTMTADTTLSGGTHSGTNTGDQTVPAAAAQSDQETATSTTTYVSPGRQQFHPSASKSWVRFNTSGTVASSYNVTSISDSGTGNWEVNIGTDFSANGAYAGTVSCGMNNSDGEAIFINVDAASTAGVFNIGAFDGTAVTARRDPDGPNEIHACFFGDQA